eukprot:TRINITY_DN38409_c0_g1_i1.p1 TRINITY_DN38409_c0_g1~~TRINITY_DN38409_c0_g1_i1.p1  ORF type:complete len:980 (+),score=104.84 TRINITY_DN38409_c0_g1_i1:84-3023(+)
MNAVASAVTDPRISEQLLTASGKGLVELVRLLLKRGANVSYARVGDGWTPLMAASSAGHLAAAEVLIEQAADVSVTAADGFSALFEASACGHSAVVTLLLEHLANPLDASPDGSSPLILASLRGHEDAVTLLLESHADVSQSKRCGFTAFRAACGNGHEGVARRLLLHQTDVIELDGVASLLAASSNGQLSVSRLLLEARVSPNAAAADGTTALLKACMANHREVATLLIRHGADLDTALDATKRKSLAGVRRLLNELRRTVSHSARDTRDLDILSNSIENSSPALKGSTLAGNRAKTSSLVARATRAIDVLPQQAAEAQNCAEESHRGLEETAPEPEATPLAVETGNALASVETYVLNMHFSKDSTDQSENRLVAKPCELDGNESFRFAASDPEGIPNLRTIHSFDANLSKQLLTASSKGIAELTELFLRRSADPNYARDSDGWTPLIAASSAGHFPVVELLLDACSTVDATASDGFTPLLEACTSGHEQIVSLLLSRGAMVSHASNDGNTAFILASLHGHAEIVSVLLEHEADITMQRADGFTALRAACGNGNLAVANILLDRGGAGIVDKEGVSALMTACANGHLVLARTLIERGVSATSASDEGTTALMQACIAGHHEVAAMLISQGAGIDQTLDAARRQNCLSRVKRVLARATPLSDAQKPTVVESRNIEDLVRVIEGRKQPSSCVPSVSNGNRESYELAIAQVGMTEDNDRSSSSSSASSSSMLLRLAKNGQKRHEAIGIQEVTRTIPSSKHVISPTRDHESTSSRVLQAAELSTPAPEQIFASSERDGPHEAFRTEGASSCRQLASASPGLDAQDLGRWSLQPLSNGVRNRAYGTFYSIEVLCEDHEQEDFWLAQDCSATETTGEARPHNAAVITARCRGRPVTELSLIPYSEAELAEAARLAEGGIALVAAAGPHGEQAGGCPSTSVSPRCCSTPRSLPDRDTRETYLAWCDDMQKGYLNAESTRCGLRAC